MKVHRITKKMIMTPWDAIKFQVMVNCRVKGYDLSEGQIECIALLAMMGEQELMPFCNKVAELKIFNSSQSARNALGKVESKGIFKKTSGHRKKIKLSPEFQVYTQGAMLLDYEILGLETDKAQGAIPNGS